jgi:hypothetical protein
MCIYHISSCLCFYIESLRIYLHNTHIKLSYACTYSHAHPLRSHDFKCQGATPCEISMPSFAKLAAVRSLVQSRFPLTLGMPAEVRDREYSRLNLKPSLAAEQVCGSQYFALILLSPSFLASSSMCTLSTTLLSFSMLDKRAFLGMLKQRLRW